jgi:hypothetical protein
MEIYCQKHLRIKKKHFISSAPWSPRSVEDYDLGGFGLILPQIQSAKSHSLTAIYAELFPSRDGVLVDTVCDGRFHQTLRFIDELNLLRYAFSISSEDKNLYVMRRAVRSQQLEDNLTEGWFATLKKFSQVGRYKDVGVIFNDGFHDKLYNVLFLTAGPTLVRREYSVENEILSIVNEDAPIAMAKLMQWVQELIARCFATSSEFFGSTSCTSNWCDAYTQVFSKAKKAGMRIPKHCAVNVECVNNNTIVISGGEVKHSFNFWSTLMSALNALHTTCNLYGTEHLLKSFIRMIDEFICDSVYSGNRSYLRSIHVTYGRGVYYNGNKCNTRHFRDLMGYTGPIVLSQVPEDVLFSVTPRKGLMKIGSTRYSCNCHRTMCDVYVRGLKYHVWYVKESLSRGRAMVIDAEFASAEIGDLRQVELAGHCFGLTNLYISTDTNLEFTKIHFNIDGGCIYSVPDSKIYSLLNIRTRAKMTSSPETNRVLWSSTLKD